MKLEWSNREAQYDRYWLELKDDNDKIIKSVLLVDCKNLGYEVAKYKYCGILITDNVSLGEAMEQVEDFFLSWWEKQLARAERDYDEAFEVVEFLKGELVC